MKLIIFMHVPQACQALLYIYPLVVCSPTGAGLLPLPPPPPPQQQQQQQQP